MILTILGIAVLIIATVQVYKTARGNGRSAGLWAGLNLGAGILLQFVLPVLVMIVVTILYIAGSNKVPSLGVEDMHTLNNYGIAVGMAGIVLSFVAMFLILRYVSRIPDYEPAAEVPPPPPETFGDGLTGNKRLSTSIWKTK